MLVSIINSDYIKSVSGNKIFQVYQIYQIGFTSEVVKLILNHKVVMLLLPSSLKFSYIGVNF